jgi:MarR-like DNA-binding transcriptional regulator SgrR of sgrS sRNA
VSNKRRGEITPIIAKEWSAQNDYKEWSFTLKENLFFSNQKPITIQDVQNSFKRSAYFIKKKKSHSEVISNLKGIEDFNMFSDSISGLTVKDNQICFKLTKSIPNFLEQVSSTIFSIISPDDYDPITLEWKNPLQITASGYYKISRIDQEKVTLVLHNKILFSELNDHYPSQIEITWTPQKNTDLFDIIFGNEYDQKLYNQNFIPKIGESNLYFRVVNSQSKNSPFHKPQVREQLKNIIYQSIYENLEEINTKFPTFKPNKSFVSQKILPSAHIKSTTSENNTEAFRAEFSHSPIKIIQAKKAGTLNDLIITTIKNKLEQLKVPVIVEPITFSSDFVKNSSTKQPADLFITMTNISIEHPADNLSFMFLSKEGLQHPIDEPFKHKLLTDIKMDFQLVNQYIFDQSVFIPITLFKTGYYLKPGIDIDLYNNLSEGFPWYLVRM